MIHKLLPIYFENKKEIEDFNNFEIIDALDTNNNGPFKLIKENEEYKLENINKIKFFIEEKDKHWSNIKKNLLIINVQKKLQITPYTNIEIPTLSYIVNDNQTIPLKEIPW